MCHRKSSAPAPAPILRLQHTMPSTPSTEFPAGAHARAPGFGAARFVPAQSCHIVRNAASQPAIAPHNDRRTFWLSSRAYTQHYTDASTQQFRNRCQLLNKDSGVNRELITDD